MSDFDWYLSPSDRFSHETQFSKHSENEKDIYLVQLDPIFKLSRLTQEEFLQIWNLIDIKGSQKLNKEQFIFFMHVLTARRKGKALPVGIPLSIKESFLKEESKSRVYIRPNNTSSATMNQKKDSKTLENDLQDLELKVESAVQEKRDADKKLSELQTTQIEFAQVAEFKRKQKLILNDELSAMKEAASSARNDNSNSYASSATNTAAEVAELRSLVDRLVADRNGLDQKRTELRREIDAKNREIQQTR